MISPKPRRTKGDGSVYRAGRFWWIEYRGQDGKRTKQSTRSESKTVALRQLRKKLGAVAHRLPDVKYAEYLTFFDASEAVLADFTTNGKASEPVVRRRITKHLRPYFEGRRLVSLTSADVVAYIAHRQKQGIVNKTGVRRADVSNAEINRELQILKRIFNLAIEQDRIATKPKIKMLQESAARSGFFEREQFVAVVRHLPVEIQPVVTMAYVTGWRVHDEILPLQWRQVDFTAGEVRLEPGTTKNGQGRVFPMTTELRTMLEAQHTEHERLKKAGHLCPHVFFREVAEERGGEKKPQPIVSFTKAWKAACRAAGCPGRIPHDLRRTAIRNFVRSGTSEHVAMKLSGHRTRSVF